MRSSLLTPVASVLVALAAFLVPVDARADGSCVQMQPTYNGGPVVHDPTLYVVYWGFHGTPPPPEQSTIPDVIDTLTGTRWLGVVRQYYDIDAETGQRNYPRLRTSPSLLGGTWYDDHGFRDYGTYSDAELAGGQDLYDAMAEARDAWIHFGEPDITNSIVVLVTPPMTKYPTEYCAYHTPAPVFPDSAAAVPYVYLPYQQRVDEAGTPQPCLGDSVYDSTVITLVHETIETIVDPLTYLSPAWQIPSTACGPSNNEIADICAPAFPGNTGYFRAPLGHSTGGAEVPAAWGRLNKGGAGECVHSYTDRTDVLGIDPLARLWHGGIQPGSGVPWNQWDTHGIVFRHSPGLSFPEPNVGVAVGVDVTGEEWIGLKVGPDDPSSPLWLDAGQINHAQPLRSYSRVTGARLATAAGWEPGRVDVFATGEQCGFALVGGFPLVRCKAALMHHTIDSLFYTSGWTAMGGPATANVSALSDVAVSIFGPADGNHVMEFAVNEFGSAQVMWHGISADGITAGGWKALPLPHDGVAGAPVIFVDVGATMAVVQGRSGLWYAVVPNNEPSQWALATWKLIPAQSGLRVGGLTSSFQGDYIDAVDSLSLRLPSGIVLGRTEVRPHGTAQTQAYATLPPFDSFSDISAATY